MLVADAASAARPLYRINVEIDFDARTYKGRERLRWVNVSRVTDVHDTGEDVVAVIRSLATGETSVLRADAIVLKRCPDGASS